MHFRIGVYNDWGGCNGFRHLNRLMFDTEDKTREIILDVDRLQLYLYMIELCQGNKSRTEC